MVWKHFDPTQNWIFWGCSPMEGGEEGKWWNLAVIRYLNKNQKIYESCEKSRNFCWYQQFFINNQNKFCYLKKRRYKLHFDNSFNFFFELLNIVLINMVTMMSAKKATTGFLKIEVFWYKGYDVIICFDDVITKIW